MLVLNQAIRGSEENDQIMKILGRKGQQHFLIKWMYRIKEREES